MKTTFIFHGGGGFTHEKSGDENADFYKELIAHVPENGKILQIPFAKDADRAASAVDQFNRNIDKYKDHKNVTVELASREKLISQILSSDVLFLHGGVSLQLLDILKQYPGLGQAIEGKVVAGVSAGMNVWSTFFYSPSAGGVFAGLGILPIKTIPHYVEEYKGKLDGVGPGLEEVLLPEYTYRIFYK